MSAELKKLVKKAVGSKPATHHTVMEVAKLIAMHKGRVTSDDVRFYITRFDPSAAVVGSALKALVTKGTLRKSGYVQTEVKTSKGRQIAEYSLA